MAGDLVIKITAQDGSTQVFKAIANGATSMGDNIERAGTKGATGLRKIDDAATKVGAGIGTAAAAAATLGQAYLLQERQLDTLTRQYGEASDEIIAFTESIQDSTRFSNEAARASASIAAGLVNQYGLSTDQIEILLTRAADLAQTQGLTLEDATQRVAAAVRGEAEAAEALGLSLGDANVAAFAASQGITNYSTTLDDAGRAQVRLNLFLEQSQFATGAAGEAFDTAGGQVAGLLNDFQDLGQAIGGFIGPVGEVAAQFAPLAIALPIVGAGFGKAATGAKAFGAAAATARIGSVGLLAALGPIGIAAAAAAGAFALYEMVTSTSDLEEAQAAATLTVEGLTTAIRDQAAAGGDTSWLQAQRDGLAALVTQVDRTQETFDRATSGEYGDAGPNIYEEMDGGRVQRLQDLAAATVRYQLNAEQLGEVETDLGVILGYTGENMDNVRRYTEEANAEYASGRIDAEAYAARIDNIANNVNNIGIVSTGAADGVYTIAEAFTALGIAERQQAAADQVRASVRERILEDRVAAEAQAATHSEELYARRRQQAEEESAANQAAAESARAIANTYRDALGQTSNVPFLDGLDEMVATGELVQAEASAISDAFGDIAASGASTLEVIVAMGDAAGYAATEAIGFATGLNSAVAEAQGVIGLYGAIDSLGQVLQSTADIADDLFGGDMTDGLGPLVDLLNEGRISQEQFNASVQAGADILADNERGQAALNEVRADQLPLLATQAEALANYYETLAELGPEEQQRALYLQDAANQAELLNIQQLVYANSIGQLPDRVTTDLIANSAAADPVLAKILEEMGLIEIGADGTITVTLADGEETVTTLGDINQTLEDLVSLIAEINGLPDPFANAAAGADAAIISINDLSAETLAYWELLRGGPPTPPALLPPRPGVGFDEGFLDRPKPLHLPNFPGLNQEDPLQSRIGTGNAVISMVIRVDDQATPDIERVAALGAGLAAREALLSIGANDDASPKLDKVAGAFNAIDGRQAFLAALADDQASPVAYAAGGAFDGINGRSAMLLALGDNASALGASAVAAGAFDGINGKSSLLFAFGDSSSAENAAAVGAGAIASIDGNAAYLDVIGQDKFSGTIAAAASYAGSVLATSYIDIITREYKGGGSLASPYANGGIIPHAANGLVMVGEAGPELVRLPGGSLVTPSPASREIAKDMRGGGITVVNNFTGTYVGVDDFVGEIAAALDQSLAMQQASLGMGRR